MCTNTREGQIHIIMGVAGVNECSKKALLNASRPKGSISFMESRPATFVYLSGSSVYPVV